jgi:hypothetical protein
VTEQTDGKHLLLITDITHNSTEQLYQYTHIHIYLHNGIKYGKPNSPVVKNRMYGSSKRDKQLHKLTIWFSSN